MGSETSQTTGNQLNFDIPSSLRSVNPFLQLAYRFLVNILSEEQDTFKRLSTNKLIVSCINKAFHLLAVTNVEIDGDGKICLENYRYARNCIIREFQFPISLSYPEYIVDKLNDNTTIQIRQHFLSLSFPHAPEIILFEADLVLSLADELNQQDEGHNNNCNNISNNNSIHRGVRGSSVGNNISTDGFREYASDQYHTAAIYYRVMQSMIQSTTVTSNNHNNFIINNNNNNQSNSNNNLSSLSNLDAKILYAATMSRKTSLLTPNIPSEHFNQHLCADVYEINGATRLGKGSYGSVYLATHRLTQDERAVKVMNVEKVTSYYLRKLHTEIAILRCIDHPNIINLQDVFFGKRSVYIVTHVCRGGELFDLLNSGKSKGFVFKENRAALLIRDMLSAIHYLHTYCSIVHRDLKLENFLFERADIDSPLVLIDFGLAKKFEKGERMKQRVGSCYYTAPEVLYSDYDYTCDIWSIGVLSYMILSGSPPFAGQNPEEVYDAILSEEAQYPARKFGHLSEQCVDFLKCLLVKNPLYRISSKNALNHPFITMSCQTHWQPLTQSAPSTAAAGTSAMRSSAASILALSSQQINQLLTSVTYFLSLDGLSQLILYLIAHSLPAEYISDVRNEFYCIDSDHSGTISYNEFCTALYTADAVQTGAFRLSLAFTELCRKSGNYKSVYNSKSNNKNSNGGNNSDNSNIINTGNDRSTNNASKYTNIDNNNNNMNVDETSHEYNSHNYNCDGVGDNIYDKSSNRSSNSSNSNSNSSLLSNVKNSFTSNNNNNNTLPNSVHSTTANAKDNYDNTSMSTFSGTTYDTYNTMNTTFPSMTTNTSNTPFKPTTSNATDSSTNTNYSFNHNNNKNNTSGHRSGNNSSANNTTNNTPVAIEIMELSYRVFIAASIPLRLIISTERLQLALSLLLDHNATATTATTNLNNHNQQNLQQQQLNQGFVITSESIRTFMGDSSASEEDVKTMIHTIKSQYQNGGNSFNNRNTDQNNNTYMTNDDGDDSNYANSSGSESNNKMNNYINNDMNYFTLREDMMIHHFHQLGICRVQQQQLPQLQLQQSYNNAINNNNNNNNNNNTLLSSQAPPWPEVQQQQRLQQRQNPYQIVNSGDNNNSNSLSQIRTNSNIVNNNNNYNTTIANNTNTNANNRLKFNAPPILAINLSGVHHTITNNPIGSSNCSNNDSDSNNNNNNHNNHANNSNYTANSVNKDTDTTTSTTTSTTTATTVETNSTSSRTADDINNSNSSKKAVTRNDTRINKNNKNSNNDNDDNNVDVSRTYRVQFDTRERK